MFAIVLPLYLIALFLFLHLNDANSLKLLMFILKISFEEKHGSFVLYL